MNTFKLEIVATDRMFFEGTSEMVVMPAIDGEKGVLAGHEAMVVALKAGELRYTVNGKEQAVAVGIGFAEIMPEKVIILTDFAEKPEEIDIMRAEQAKEQAEEALRLERSQVEYIQSRIQLSRAMAELRVAKKHTGR